VTRVGERRPLIPGDSRDPVPAGVLAVRNASLAGQHGSILNATKLRRNYILGCDGPGW